MSEAISKIIHNNLEVYIIRETPEFTQEDIGKQLGSLIANPETPRNLRIMVVAKDAVPQFTINEATSMDMIINAVLEHFDTFRQAFVVTTPQNTAFTMAYQNKIKDKRYQVQVFYTEKVAIEWLTKI